MTHPQQQEGPDAIAMAFYDGFTVGICRERWDDCYDWAALVARDYSAGKPLPPPPSENSAPSPSEASASGSPRDEVALSEDILFYAFRYALGRMTYAVEHVAEALIANAPRLSPRLRDLVLKEIDACPSLGMEADRRPWRRVYDAFLALVGGEAVDLDASFADQSTVPRNDQIQSSQALKGELVEALKAIQLCAFSDGTRTFDDCMKSLQWIDDHARLALTKASDTPSQAERS